MPWSPSSSSGWKTNQAGGAPSSGCRGAESRSVKGDSTVPIALTSKVDMAWSMIDRPGEPDGHDQTEERERVRPPPTGQNGREAHHSASTSAIQVTSSTSTWWLVRRHGRAGLLALEPQPGRLPVADRGRVVERPGEPEAGHVPVDALVLAVRDQVRLVEDPDRAVGADRPVEAPPGRQVRLRRAAREAVEVLERAPVLDQ